MLLYWKAIYNDGTSLLQVNEDGTENKYFQIDKSKLSSFLLSGYAKFNNYVKVIVHLDPNKKLIYRRRVAKRLGGIDEVVYIVGWQENRSGVNVQSLNFIFDDGHIEILDRFREDKELLYPIQFLPEDEII